MAQTLIRHEQIEDVYAFRASLGSLAVLNNVNYSSISGLPSLGSLAVLNSLALTDLNDVSFISLASGQTLKYDGISWVNLTSKNIDYFGEFNTDPTGITPRNGDEYYNNLDEKVQVYVNGWKELNGAKRFSFQDNSLFQMQNDAYFQFQS